MNISELPALLFAGFLQKWKRRAVVYAVCAVCLAGIAFEGIAIGRILLERAFGPIGGRLLVAGLLLMIILLALATLWQLERTARLARATRNTQENASDDPRVALIAQAINLGYTFARGFDADKPRPPPEPAAEEDDINRAPSSARAAE